MSEKQVKKYRRVIMKEMVKNKNIFMREFVSEIKNAPILKRIAYAWAIIKG